MIRAADSVRTIGGSRLSMSSGARDLRVGPETSGRIAEFSEHEAD
jgi:hypothetical protein